MNKELVDIILINVILLMGVFISTYTNSISELILSIVIFNLFRYAGSRSYHNKKKEKENK